jgi:hypothetical protein
MATKKMAGMARGGFGYWTRAEFVLLVALTYPLFLAAVVARRLAARRPAFAGAAAPSQGVFGQALAETRSTIAIAFTG